MCQVCYEEMPCGVLAGEVSRPRVEEDEWQEQMAEHQAVSDRREALWALLSERMEQLGIIEDGRPLRMLRFGLTITLKQETFAQIISLIPTDSKGVNDGNEVQARELEPGEDLPRLWHDSAP